MTTRKQIPVSRRQFLGALAAAVAAGPQTLAMQQPGPAGIPLRPLGRTGVSVPIIGYGGWHSVAGKTEAESIQLMHEAIDVGITFWDNAWEYHRGLAEEVMGKAFDTPGRRQKVFLMTKVCARDYAGFQRQFEESLRRLRTDHVDLLQFHAIQYPGDPEQVFDPEKGGLRAALEARRAGKLRYLGFSGHMYTEAHLKMLSLPHEWDTVQMPLNLLDAHYSSFQKTVLPECQRKGIGVLGMKSLGGGQTPPIPREVGVDPELCRRYALSLPVSSLVCGILNREQLQQMARIARDFKPLTDEQTRELLAKSAGPAREGQFEQYKNPRSGYGCSWQDQIRAQG